jgi:NADH-quinone oxidoreductase subunit K
MVPMGYYLTLSLLLFSVGLIGVLVRRNILVILMSVEIMINAVNLNFVTFAVYFNDWNGQVLALFVIAVEAVELAVALVIILAYWRHREALESDRINLLRG